MRGCSWPSPCRKGVVKRLWKADKKTTTHDHPSWETRFERDRTFQVFDLITAQRYFQSLYIGEQMLDLSTSDNRENIRCLLHEVGDGNLNTTLASVDEYLSLKNKYQR
jgi:hypothetical protein